MIILYVRLICEAFNLTLFNLEGIKCLNYVNSSRYTVVSVQDAALMSYSKPNNSSHLFYFVSSLDAAMHLGIDLRFYQSINLTII